MTLPRTCRQSGRSSAFDFGTGSENVSPRSGADGAPDTVTDTWVPRTATSTWIAVRRRDAAVPLTRATPSPVGGRRQQHRCDAFSIGDTTFDPTLAAGVRASTCRPTHYCSAVFADRRWWLDLGAGFVSVPLAAQDFDVCGGTGTAPLNWNIDTGEVVADLLGLTDAEFTVDSVTGTSADLPTVGSVYDVFNFGGGSRTSTPTSPVPLPGRHRRRHVRDAIRSIDLGSLFDAVQGFDPGDALPVVSIRRPRPPPRSTRWPSSACRGSAKRSAR